MENYLVYGLARSGIAAAKLLLKNLRCRDGGQPRTGSVLAADFLDSSVKTGGVFLFDESVKEPGTNPELKNLTEDGAVLLTREDIELFLPLMDVLVLSPGISVYGPLVRRAGGLGIKISGELELGFQNTGCRIIAVTGTNGKTTVSSMIYGMLREAGVSSGLAGNIGFPLCACAEKLKAGDFCVVETSSFQLETIEKFRPHIAVLTNITPDHLDRHMNFENYVFTKARIFENQDEDDFAVLNAGDENVRKLVPHIKSKIYSFSTKEKTAGAYLSGGFLFFSPDGVTEEKIMPASDLMVAGRHNIENALAAAVAARLAGVSAAGIAAALRKFSPIAHRMERCGKIGDVEFVNDSKATNVSSVLPALSAFEKNVCLILGGRDKGCGFDSLFENLKPNIIHTVFLGEAADKLAAAAVKYGRTNYTKAASLEEAVRVAYAAAGPSGVVLLSPACASFDMFKDYEDRGERFKMIFRELKSEIEG